MKCEDIQSVLFDYMSRELGSARSDLVREHLRKCARCQAAARDIDATLKLLRDASEQEEGIPDHLSEERRRLILRALTHPVMDWIYRHHVVSSLIIMIMVIAAAVVLLMKMSPWQTEPPPGLPPVIIGTPPTNAAVGTTGGADSSEPVDRLPGTGNE